MKVSNKQNLPQALVNAVSVDRHNKKGEYSATTLLKGACEVVLTSRYFDKIEVDASDSIWAVFGTAVHSIFEKQADETFKEERFEVSVSNSKVTGRVDSYDLKNEIIVDWKTASTWKVIYKDFSDWEKQGLIYSWLMKKSGLNVKKCRFIALLKDHSKSKARTDSNYPQSPVYIYEFDVTEEKLAEIEKFIIDKVEQFEEAEKLADWEIKPCTKEERWESPTKYAVMKQGRKTAIKLFDDKKEAEEKMESLGGTYIEDRIGEPKKCADYCPCKDFCPLYQSMNK